MSIDEDETRKMLTLGWPPGWDEARRERLVSELHQIGYELEGESLWTMAEQIDELGTSIDDMIEYLRYMQDLGKRLTEAFLNRHRKLRGVRSVYDAFAPNRRHGILENVFRLVVIVVVAPALLLYAVPIRLYYWRRIKAMIASQYPWYKDWVAERSTRKSEQSV